MKILFFEIFTVLGEIAGGDAKQVCYLSDEFRKQGDQTEALNLHYKDWLFIRDFKFIARFLSLSRKDVQADVIFASGTPFWSFATYILKRKIKTPALLYITHSNDLWAKVIESFGISKIAWKEGGILLFIKSFFNSMLFIFLVLPDIFKSPRLFSFYLKRLDKIVVSCEYMRNRLAGLVDRKKIEVVYPLIEQKTGQPCLPDESGLFTIFYFGAFYSGRGVLDLLYVFLALKDKHPQIRLVICGYPKYEASSELIARRMVEKYHLEERVKLSGYSAGVLGDLAKASLICMPFHDAALFQPPLTLLEAMRMGKCVISTECGAVNEFITDSESGFLVRRKNLPALIQKIDYLINNPGLLQMIGSNARASVEKKCDFSKNCAQFKRLLEQSLAGQ